MSRYFRHATRADLLIFYFLRLMPAMLRRYLMSSRRRMPFYAAADFRLAPDAAHMRLPDCRPL